MNGMARRLGRLEAAGGTIASPHARQYLGIHLTNEEREWIEANPLQPMTEAEKKEFDAWWHDPSRGAWKS